MLGIFGPAVGLGMVRPGTPALRASPAIISVSISPNSGEAGEVFTASAQVSGHPVPSLAWAWLLDGSPIPGATGASHPSAEGEIGAGRLSVRVTATNGEGSAGPVESDPVTVTHVAPAAPEGLADQVLAEHGGVRTLDASSAFTGAELGFALVSPPSGVTIDAVTGKVSIDTGATGVLAEALVVVRAANSGGYADSAFGLTVAAAMKRAETGAVLSVWTGQVDPTSLVASARTDGLGGEVVFVASTSPDFTAPILSAPVSPDPAQFFAKGRIGGLAPGSDYHLGVAVGGTIDLTRLGRFRTPPATAHSFSFGFASCARTGSNELVFDAIRARDLDFFAHTGDLHYGNIGIDDEVLFHQATDLVFGAGRQNALWRSLPMVYAWDDHDYGGNDAHGGSASRRAALAWFRNRVPVEPAEPSGAVHYSFRRGRVIFAMLDARSERSPGGARILSEAQEQWLVGLMRDAGPDEYLFIGLGVPWVSAAGGDTWFGAAAQRERIGAAIARHMPGRVVGFAGDMHALGFVPAANNPHGSFPVMHAAPLDQENGSKGTGYAIGPVAVSQSQYGAVTVEDSGSGPISLTFRGISVDRATGAEIERFAAAFTLEAQPPDLAAPELSAASAAASGTSAATGSVVTNEGTGTLHWVATTSATAPGAQQVEDGLDHAGAAAAASGSRPVAASGAVSFSVAGLQPGTGYWVHFVHRDAAWNRSAVATTNGFTTETEAPGLKEVAVLFDPAISHPGLVFSNGNRSVTDPAGDGRWARGGRYFATGRWYFESQKGAGNMAASGAVGIGTAAASTTQSGSSSTLEGVWVRGTGQGFSMGQTYIPTGLPNYYNRPDAVIRFAFDLDARRMWFGIDALWSGDPGAGTGGVEIPEAREWTPYINPRSGEMTLRTVAADFVHAPPAGFLPLGAG